MRLLYLDWPHLCFRLEAARTSDGWTPAEGGEPPASRAAAAEGRLRRGNSALPDLVVVGGQPWEQGEVVDCSPAARRLGVERGLPLGTAHRLVPEARFLAADLPGYQRAMEVALDALANFTPSLEAEPHPEGRAFGQVLLGIEGLHRLWGDEETLTGRVTSIVAKLLPGEPRIGIANTRFGAQVAAVVGRGSLGRVPVGDAAVEAAYLAPLSIKLLPADDETRDRLRVFGLTRIGQFAALSRSAVIARFGAQGGELHDLARGLDGRQLRPRKPIAQLRAEAELEPPVDTLEPLRFLLRSLCQALCEQLNARGAGATRALLQLDVERGPAVVLEQALPEPAAAPELLERLLFARLGNSMPAAAVTRLAVELRGEQVVAGQQLGLFAPQLARAARLDWQLIGLALRFGPDRLLRARLLDPEAALADARSELFPVGADSRLSAA